MASCGCYYHVASMDYYVRMTKHYLPLLDSEAHSTILSSTSRTVLKQTFANPSSSEAISECIYTFPLYDGVSVVSFTCTIGSKVLRGLVKEKVKAKEIFDQAVAKGETAGLLEQAVEASDVFSTKLGNIPAGESVIVEITYIGELKHHETDGIRFTIPTKIAPRFGAGPWESVVHGSLPIQDSSGIKITVDVNMPEGSFIKTVQSPSHPIAVSMGTLSTAVEADPLMSKASATLSLGSAALEKDFVLIVQSKYIGIPKAILETHPTIPNHRALMATLVPKFSLRLSRPEIVFVADRSGSMEHNIPMLVSAMKVFLKSMPVGVKFNICSFGSSTSFLWQQSKSYTSETLQQATAHVGTFNADMGGTETFNAIKATIERRFTDLPLEIILLTDGDIWQQEKLFVYVNEQVDKTDGKIRIFPLGIGNGVSHSLIEGLARAGNGFAQSVQQGERLDNCVVRMLRGALSPHITDYTLEVKYEKEDDDFEVIEKVTDGMKVLLSDNEPPQSTKGNPEQPTISLFDPKVNPEKEDIKMQDAEPRLPQIPYPKLLQAPHKIPTLFAFSRTAVYLLMSSETIQRNPTSVVLRATSVHGPLALEIPIEVCSIPAETIHQLAAKKAVQDLEEGRGWLFDAKDQAGVLVKQRFPSSVEELVKKEAVRLGEKFQVAGKWCSFVAASANDVETATNYDVETATNYDVESSKRLKGTYYRPYDSVKSRKRCRYKPKPAQKRIAEYSIAEANGQADVLENLDFEYFSHDASKSSQAGSPNALMAFSKRSAPRPKHRSAEPDGLFDASRSRLVEKKSPKRIFNLMRRSAISSHSVPQRAKMSLNPTGGVESAVTRTHGGGGGGAGSLASCAVPSGSQNTSNFEHMLLFNCVPQSIGATSPIHFSTSTGGLFREQALPPPAARAAGMTSTEEVDWTAKWASKSATEKLIDLISLQDFEGYWPEDDKEIPAILGFEIPKCTHGASPKVWVTLLVICFLEVKNGDEEGTWGMVVEKAKDWLAGSVMTELEELEKKAREFVMGH